MSWVRRIGGAVSTRVLAVVIIAGAIPLALASVAITWLVTDDKQAALVEGAVAEASATREQIEHAAELARAQLRAVALAATEDRLLAVPDLVSAPMVAVRCERDGVVLVRAATEEDANPLLEDAADVAPEGRLHLLEDGQHAVIATRLDDVVAIGLLDLRALLHPPSGWVVELANDPGHGRPATLVAERQVVRGQELVAASAITRHGLRVEVEAPLAPARAVAGELVRDVVLWTLLAFLPLLVLGFVMARAVTAPVRQLARAVRGAKGPVGPLRLPANEIGDLGVAIAGMSERLHGDARVLRCAVRFARRVHRLTREDHLLGELGGLMEEAFPRLHWHVLSRSDLENGPPPADVDLSPELLLQLLTPAAALADPASESAVNELGRVNTFVIEDHVCLTLAATGDPCALVVAQGPIDESTLRMAEILCRTAAAALANQELQQAAVNDEKLQVLGRLAAGVAHEMNNPLAFVAANLKILEDSLEGELLEMARDAREGTDRLARIVSDMSSISRGGRSYEREPHYVETIAQTAVKVARRRRPTARVKVIGGEGLVAECDRIRIEQIVLNLVLNAIDAVPEGRQPAVEVRLAERGDELTIDVADNGSGIAEDVLANIFDPFFTTKGRRGTGLGLFLSRSFAEADGGSLTALDTGAEGTTFRLTMPRSTAEPRKSAPSEPAVPVEGREVLVIDDEPAIVRAMSRLLRRYATVTGVTDPCSALTIAAERSFSVVLCDLNMPEMSGYEFRDALMAIRPDLAERVVFMSGSIDTECEAPVLQKPIDPRSLKELFDGH